MTQTAHAPRQTGKTSTLLAFRDPLNGGEAGDDFHSRRGPASSIDVVPHLLDAWRRFWLFGPLA